MRIAPVATPIRLAARALPSTAAFDARMGPLVGQPEAAVIRALDVPARSTEAGGPRFIEYERRRVVGTPEPAAWRWGSPFAGAFIETRDGRVERFDRRGNDRLALPGDPST